MEEILKTLRQPREGRRAGEWMTPRARREARDFFIMIAPWLLGFVFLNLVPLLLGFAASFTNYNGLNLDRLKFMGLDNFTRALDLENKDFWISLFNTFKYAVIVVPVGQMCSLGLAALLNQKIRGRAIFRMLFYVPAILPLAGATRAWNLLWNKNSGLVNAVLSLISPGTAVNWTYDYFFLVLYLYVWWHAGGGMVIYLAGLQGVPDELKEAALIDGANKFQVFRNVTLPLLTPVIFFQSILGIIGALQVMQVPILIYGRAGLSGNVQMPRNMYMYMIYIYSQVFDFQRYGYGVALSWIFFVIVLVLTLLFLFSSRYWVYYEVPQEGERA
jgi:multiple sugar transport system permease protein